MVLCLKNLIYQKNFICFFVQSHENPTNHGNSWFHGPKIFEIDMM